MNYESRVHIKLNYQLRSWCVIGSWSHSMSVTPHVDFSCPIGTGWNVSCLSMRCVGHDEKLKWLMRHANFISWFTNELRIASRNELVKHEIWKGDEMDYELRNTKVSDFTFIFSFKTQDHAKVEDRLWQSWKSSATIAHPTCRWLSASLLQNPGVDLLTHPCFSRWDCTTTYSQQQEITEEYENEQESDIVLVDVSFLQPSTRTAISFVMQKLLEAGVNAGDISKLKAGGIRTVEGYFWVLSSMRTSSSLSLLTEFRVRWQRTWPTSRACPKPKWWKSKRQRANWFRPASCQ